MLVIVCDDDDRERKKERKGALKFDRGEASTFGGTVAGGGEGLS